MLLQKISIIFLFLQLSTDSNGQNFYNIPKQYIRPYLILQDSLNPYRLKSKNCVLETDNFSISNLITLGEFKEYIAEIKKDSSHSFYLSQWPDYSIASEENYKQYITNDSFNNYPAAGITWNAAMNFCKWKTLKDNKTDTISFIYRLPRYVEWIAALGYLDGNKIKHDFNNNFSDWTTNLYCEAGCLGSYGDSCSGYKGLDYYPLKNAPPRMNRMYALGNSFNFNRKTSYIRGYYTFKGYRHIAFRIVKSPIKDNNQKKSFENKILESWGISNQRQ
ncbi:MAG: SUMF1/EgtB/PvdO family nonheme iron enzyme [Chitinophagaceae bacterium]|nr:SUMF1/EgtB/PvdO family nonheme iron enzyme [Chitinophagaceae bacterium]